MGKAMGYGLSIQEETRVGIGFTRTGKSSWLMADMTTAGAADPLPREFVGNVEQGGGNLTLVVPNELVRTVLLSLPPLKGKELKRGVLGMVARQEKCSPEELVVSWRVLGEHREPGGQPALDIMTLVMRSEDRDQMLAEAKALGVAPSCMLPGYMILDDMFRLAGPPVPGDGAWTLVYLGQGENFLNISSAESLLLTRSLPVNLEAEQDQEAFLGRLATEIERSRFFIRQGSHSPEIKQIVVCGDPALAQPLVNHLNGEDGGLTAIHWAAEHLFSNQGEPIATPLLIPALGAALALESPAQNILGTGRRRWLSAKARRRLMLAGTAAAMGMVPMVLSGSLLTRKIQENYLVQARQRLEAARVEAQQAAEVYKASRLLDNQQLCLDWKWKYRLDAQTLLDRLAAAAPDQVVFKSLRIFEGEQDGYKLQIIGDSRGPNAETAQAFYLDFQKSLSDLNDLAGFQEPRLMEIETIRHDGEATPLTHFTLDLEIAPRAEEKS